MEISILVGAFLGTIVGHLLVRGIAFLKDRIKSKIGEKNYDKLEKFINSEFQLIESEFIDELPVYRKETLKNLAKDKFKNIDGGVVDSFVDNLYKEIGKSEIID